MLSSFDYTLSKNIDSFLTFKVHCLNGTHTRVEKGSGFTVRVSKKCALCTCHSLSLSSFPLLSRLPSISREQHLSNSLRSAHSLACSDRREIGRNGESRELNALVIELSLFAFVRCSTHKRSPFPCSLLHKESSPCCRESPLCFYLEHFLSSLRPSRSVLR